MPKIRKEEVFDALPEAFELDKVQAMMEQWGTTVHLSKVCHMTRTNVTANLVRLQQEGRVHVHDWVGTALAAVWVKGKGVNKPRPVVPDAEKQAARREKHRLYEQRRTRGAPEDQPGRAVMRKKATIEKAKVAPRSWFSALEDAQGERT